MQCLSMQPWCSEGLPVGHGRVLRAQGQELPSHFHPLIAYLSSSQSLQVRLSEFVVVCSPLLQHCRASGHNVGDGAKGGDGWHPQGLL